ncbi:MAG: sulfite exporter TauE/SafE family protein [Bacteroidales bacterium]|nr:sulfite exporter TauE/SafE family protein [Bacteroidales bacterium]MCF8389826.1 sulfite exporter TauE/SafE family protein [Bacteroidales bacterium]
MTLTHILILIAIGLLAGIVGGTMGVGGGIIIIPALVYVLGMSQHWAQGTSLATLLGPIGILAVINYHKAGYVNWKYAAILMVTFMVGSYFGSKWSVQLPDKSLKQIFGVMMLLAGFKMILGK